MTWRLMRWTMVGVLVLGLVGSALAARTQTGSSRSRSSPGHRSAVAHREHNPLPPIGESLAVPRIGGLPEPPGAVGVNAASAILVDGKSGTVLFERYPDAPRSPASVTKILTALVERWTPEHLHGQRIEATLRDIRGRTRESFNRFFSR